jgi:tetratricopeptide (TPR) repeat protein
MKDDELAKRTADRNAEGREAEAQDDVDAAIKLYEQNIKEGYADPFAFDRLMILYRKLKRYKDELRVINRGIKVFTAANEKRRKSMFESARSKRQVHALSAELMKKTGLADKKGNELYQPEPLGKWMKRKEVVEKKL